MLITLGAVSFSCRLVTDQERKLVYLSVAISRKEGEARPPSFLDVTEGDRGEGDRGALRVTTTQARIISIDPGTW